MLHLVWLFMVIIARKIWCSSDKLEVLYTTCVCSLNSYKNPVMKEILSGYKIQWHLFQKKKDNLFINFLWLKKKNPSLPWPRSARAHCPVAAAASGTHPFDRLVSQYSVSLNANEFMMLTLNIFDGQTCQKGCLFTTGLIPWSSWELTDSWPTCSGFSGAWCTSAKGNRSQCHMS